MQRKLRAMAVIAVAAAAATLAGCGEHRTNAGPASIYSPAAEWESAKPGEVLVTAPIDGVPSGGTGQFIQYRSQDADGSPTVSSGTVYFPAGSAQKRPLVVFAHGTIGMGPECAPSATTGPVEAIWGLDRFLSAGYVVVAPDYSQLGTPGTLQYLVPQAAANDLAYAARAAQNMPGANAGSDIALVGHSQGGFNVLWGATLIPKIDPSLKVVATVAESPAANLASWIHETWDQPIGWNVQVETMVAWPKQYKQLSAAPLLTPFGEANYRQLAQQCLHAAEKPVADQYASGDRGFASDPSLNPAWRAQMDANTPPAPNPAIPTLFILGGKDQVVPVGTQAALATTYCAQGSNIYYDYLPNGKHDDTMVFGTAAASALLGQAFTQTTNPSLKPYCGVPAPIKVDPPAPPPIKPRSS